MEHRRLGRSGLQVSLVGLGCNNFGRRIDAEATRNVVETALDLGVTLFDTADVYGAGLSEEYLGRALGPRRNEVIVATKFGMSADPAVRAGASRRYILRAVEASLARLGTDYIDLYQIHAPDSETPIDETLGALDDLVRRGLVRYVGCSNFTGWMVADATWRARTRNLTPFVSAQNHYNLLDRRVERELVPACNEFGLGILPYFPLASGLLTGKYRRGEKPGSDTRLGADERIASRALGDDNFDRVEKFEAFAAERGRSLLELANGWLATQPHVSSVIAGATRPEQVEQNVKAAEWRLTDSDLVALAPLLRRG